MNQRRKLCGVHNFRAGYGGCNKTLEREKWQIKPAREKRVVRWLSRGIAHIERAKNTRALRIVRVRVCDVLYSVHWNILCPCAFSSYFST